MSYVLDGWCFFVLRWYECACVLRYSGLVVGMVVGWCCVTMACVSGGELWYGLDC